MNGAPINPVLQYVNSTTWISSSSKLVDISLLFRRVSKTLKDVSTSKAGLLLKPLQNKAIFPVIDGSGKSGYDTLMDTSNISWSTVDQPTMRESFQGKIPLLAL
jgi:hypothetical protein